MRSVATSVVCALIIMLVIISTPNQVVGQCVESCQALYVLTGEAPGDQFGWKSNYLGDDIRKYDTAAMSKVMVDNLYILQYHIYSVALNQYLKVRHPGYCHAEHFGGVFYIFLRGIDASAGAQYGVYTDRPSEEIIAALTEGLLDL